MKDIKPFWAIILNCQSVVLRCQIKAYNPFSYSQLNFLQFHTHLVQNVLKTNAFNYGFGSFVSFWGLFYEILRGKKIMRNIILSICLCFIKYPFRLRIGIARYVCDICLANTLPQNANQKLYESSKVCLLLETEDFNRTKSINCFQWKTCLCSYCFL